MKGDFLADSLAVHKRSSMMESEDKHMKCHMIPLQFQSNSPPPKSGPEDDIYSYNCALLEDGLFVMNFLDAVKEGSGARIVRQYKFLLLICKADGQHSTKYALECLYQAFLIESLFSP